MAPKTKTSRTRKPVVPVSPLDAIIAVVRAVTVSNVIAVVRDACVNHGIVARNVGRYTGMRVVAFQNMTMVRNAEWQLDDCQIAALWAIEFPAAVGRVFALNGRMGTVDARAIADAIAIVRGVRAHWNRNGHGDPAGRPTVESVAYGPKRFDIPADVVTVNEPKPATTGKPRGRKSA